MLNKYRALDREPINLSFLKRGSRWNNEFATYDELMQCLFKNNALLADTAGSITRCPGQFIFVAVDRSQQSLISESKLELDDNMTRYRGLEGPWIIFRVHNKICPSGNPSFRQFLSLARNFTIDLSNKSK